MSDPIASVDTQDAASRFDGAGTYIGPYKLLQPIGEGGFGTVFEAEQTHPVKRHVALKLVKLGMDTRDVLARFEAERQALAMMDHPHIARVLHAGATETGRPYFVMELVRGEPISSYCDKRCLPITERLKLFEQVCAAVQHAHTKGIIHRDIKPSNVLVSSLEDKPFAKVIDFGIAKATIGRLTDKTLFTAQYQLIGTPVYMSPEQAEGSADIDTRSDIYSLGVLLYKLLTDSTPYESVSQRLSGTTDFKRLICEADPPVPSACLRQAAAALPEIARMRGTDPGKLTRTIRGELDWIVMKAIEKERPRRYETANGLAMDVHRYLAGQPVFAAPPSATYRLKKFVRRHVGAVAAGAAIAAMLIVGVVGFATQAHIAQARAKELEQVSKFQADMLAQVNPTKAGKELTDDVKAELEAALVSAGVPESDRSAQLAAFSTQWQRVNSTDAARHLIDRTILKPAVAAVEEQFKDQPLVDAALSQVLADRYQNLGLFDAALPLQEHALAIRRRILGEEHPDTLTSISEMGLLLENKGKLSESEPYFREALEKRRRILGEEHRDTLESIGDVGNLLFQQGKLSEAEPFFREALDKSRRALGDDSEATLGQVINMGNLLMEQGKPNEAEPLLRQALQRSRHALGEEHPYTMVLINNMGAVLQAQGKPNEAEPFYREALEKSRRVLGDEHPDTLNQIGIVGQIVEAEGKLSEAEPYLREALEKSRRVLGDEHMTTLQWSGNLGYLLFQQGRLSEAEPILREALEKNRRILGEEHLQTLITISRVGEVLQAQGKHLEAIDLLAPAEDAIRDNFRGSFAWRAATVLRTLGAAKRDLGGFADAETNLIESHGLFMRTRGPTHKDTRDCMREIVVLYTMWHAAAPGRGYDAKAAEWQRKVDALHES
ncbi:MAG TPA: tetratricopeptide repeat protein [Rudaea sp.]|nr:tetratricopeptide repeat protein [Rudaea sp.]